MNFLLEAAAEIADFLEKEGIPYVYLGIQKGKAPLSKTVLLSA